MPNIEMYGIREEDLPGVTKQIISAFHGKPWQKDYVLTFVKSAVLDHLAVIQPFIRLVTTPSPHIDEILAELKNLNIDIEVLLLQQFIPKT